MAYTFIGSCMSCDGEDIRTMREKARLIKARAFKRHAWNWKACLAPHITSVRDEDSFIGTFRSTYQGRPCVYLAWSGYEFVWAKDEGRKQARRTARAEGEEAAEAELWPED